MRWIVYLGTGLAVATAVAGIWRYMQLTQAMRYIALVVCFDATTEAVATVLLSLSIHNLFLLPLSLAGEGLLLTLAYRRALVSPRLGRWLLGALGTYLAFVVVQAWLKLGTTQYFAVAQVVSNLYFLGLAALYFRRLLNDLHTEHLSRDPFFWVSVGLALYALGNMFIALTSDYILTHFSHEAQVLVLRGVRNLFNIALYLAYLVALLLRPAPRPAA